MRLGQLARKLEIRPAEIVAYLATKNILLEDDTNARLDDEHLALITAHFGPAPQPPEEPHVPEANKTEEFVATHQTVAEEAQPESKRMGDTAEPEAGLKEEIDVIKAPRIELKGLKVIGKIDLPEPKKKEATSPPVAEATKAETRQPGNFNPRSEKKAGAQKKPRNDGRPRKKNAVVLQREREAREAEEKRRLEAMRLKEKRTQYYYNKVQAHVPTKAARIVKEPVEQISEHELVEEPKTWWGRFLRWLTT